MEILNVKVEEQTAEKLDRLVRRNVYKNKSEAVRKMLEEHLQEHPELFAPDNLEELFKQAYDSTSDQQFEKLAADVFKGRNTAAQMVAEGRERQ
ncbi:MAG TPA: ribbon-helix-helix protein, CopG family [Nitrososphaera sp.]|nr:ribbon-helix-helix protein, CopG family [Nitrososphaera sp.]